MASALGGLMFALDTKASSPKTRKASVLTFLWQVLYFFQYLAVFGSDKKIKITSEKCFHAN